MNGPAMAGSVSSFQILKLHLAADTPKPNQKDTGVVPHLVWLHLQIVGRSRLAELVPPHVWGTPKRSTVSETRSSESGVETFNRVLRTP